MSPYAPIVVEMKRRYALRVRRWRTTMTGCAWRAFYRDGRHVNWIEAPYPRTPISLAVFLHEVGHHAIGLDRHSPHCVEEDRAWRWALAQMRRHGITPDARTLTRVARSVRYAVEKDLRKGIAPIPAPLRARLPAA